MWAMVANPLGAVITVLVGALVALGVWVSDNWSGIKEFFKAFRGVFLEGIGGANGPLGTMVGHLKDAATWIGNLLGTLDESGTKWRSWGASVGIAAAIGVNAVVDAIKSLIGLFTSAYDGAVKPSGAIANMWRGGGAGAVPGAPKSPYVSNSIAGARSRRTRDVWQAVPCRRARS